MFEAIRYISSGFTLIAFVVAALVWAYGRTVDNRRQMIRDAQTDRQADLVARTLRGMNIDVRKLSPNQQYKLALEQLRARSRKSYLVAAVVVLLAIIAAIVAVQPGVAAALFRVPDRPRGLTLKALPASELIGGEGGSTFTTTCGPGQVITGFSGRAGDWVVYRLSALCASLSLHPTPNDSIRKIGVSPASLTPARGSEEGSHFSVQCSPGAFLHRVDIQKSRFERGGTYVTAIRGRCAEAAIAHDGAVRFLPRDSLATVGSHVDGVGSVEFCGGQAVPTGLTGRSGEWLDALAITCSELHYL
ncbi:MAG TPA: hypothetical protein VFS20_01160 [Longimicrobium sp.]|nr:hypothetical protein [Longimicrobium sp.]